MSLWEYYLQFTSQILDGSRPCPAGIVLTETEDMARAVELYSQIDDMGIAAFVKAFAAAEGIEIPQEAYDGFHPEDVQGLLSQLPSDLQGDTTAQMPRSAYEVLLDCCCLEDRLVSYLMQVLKEGDALGFFKLARITTRMDLQPGVFLAWMATLEQRAPEEERRCAVIMDACFDRLLAEGRLELLAALLSGDQKTFEAFRCEAPELMHTPAATFSWYETHYLDRYYPIRVLMKANGIVFPGV